MKTVMLMLCCVSVLMYWYLPVWQLIAAFDVLVIAGSYILETIGKELKEEILKEFE